MKKMIVGALAAMALAVGGASMMPAEAPPGYVVLKGTSMGKSTDTQHRAQAPSQNERAIREAEAEYRYRRFTTPPKHKNRGPGERAHRKWRKARSAGRR